MVGATNDATRAPRVEASKICALAVSVKGLGGRDMAPESHREAVSGWSAADLCGGISQQQAIGTG